MTSNATIRFGGGAVCLASLLALICAAGAQTLEFDLHDAYGRQVQSQDYQGRPLFLEFGAC